jgi:hypothetical protein
MPESRGVMRAWRSGAGAILFQVSDIKINISQDKNMTRKHFVTPIIDETLYSLRNLAEKGSRGFDCSEHSLSVVKSWAQAPAWLR